MRSKAATYALNVVLGAAVSLCAIPTIIAAVGPAAWASLAAAQAVGTIAAIVIEFGWGYVGPANVAAIGAARERAAYLAQSLSARMFLALGVIPVALVVILVVTPTGHPSLAAAMAGTSMAVQGLASPWFYVGSGDPRRLLVADSLPRAAGTIAGLFALSAGGGVEEFAALQLVGALTPFLYCVVFASRASADWGWRCRAIGRRLKSNGHAVAIALSAAAYGLVPMVVVAVRVPGALPSFALADRFSKYALVGTQPIIQLAQGHVPATSSPVELRERCRRALNLALVAGLGVGSLFAIFAPLGARVLTQGDVAIGIGLCLPMGIVVGSVMVTGIVGLACLVALGRVRAVAASTFAGALVGLPLAIVVAPAFGGVGVAWSVAVAELFVLVVQVVALRSALRPRSTSDSLTDGSRL